MGTSFNSEIEQLTKKNSSNILIVVLLFIYMILNMHNKQQPPFIPDIYQRSDALQELFVKVEYFMNGYFTKNKTQDKDQI